MKNQTIETLMKNPVAKTHAAAVKFSRLRCWLWVLTVVFLMASATFLAVAQEGDSTTPQIMPISLSKPKPKGQTGLRRPYGDGNTWVFQIAPAGDFRWVDGPHWQYPTSGAIGPAAVDNAAEPVEISWGSFHPSADKMSLSWISANGCGPFTIKVTGKIVGVGGGPGGDGKARPIDIEASWDGSVASPPPPVEECDGSISGETGCTSCGCPDEISQRICVTAGGFILRPAFGPPIGLQLVQNSRTGGWDDNLNKKLQTGPDGKVTLKDPAGREDTFNADGSGEPGDERRMVQNPDGSFEIVNADGSREIYRPGAGGVPVLVEQRDALGNAVVITRGADGKLEKVTAADGQEVDIARNGEGKISGFSDEHGRGTTMAYNGAGQVASSTNTEGQTVAYTYDAEGRVLTMTDWRGVTNYTYEGGNGVGETGYSAPGQPMGQAKRTTIEHPDGTKEEYFWDGYGNSWHVAPQHYIEYVDATTNNSSPDVPKTITKVETIAGEGKVVESSDELGNTTQFEYDPVSGLLLKVTSADGTSTSTTYNAKGNPLVVTDADGKTTTFEYAANGEDVTKIRDSAGNTVATFTYDDKHQVLTATDRDGKTTTTTYTAWGAVASEKDANNITTTYSYDADSKLLSSISRAGSTLGSFTYDARQRVATQTDTTGFTVAFTYAAADRVTKTTYPDGTFEEVSYSECCGASQAKPAWTKDRAGRTTNYAYDQMGQLTKITDAAGRDVEYLYDVGGNLKQLKDTKDNSTTYTYDAAGQISKKTYADGTYEQMTYNNVGQLIGSRDAKNNVVNYEYDVAGRITKLDYPQMTDVTMSYDALGRLATKTDSLGATSYSYDTLGRVTSIDGPWDNDTISYSYDALGRQTALSINGVAQAEYSYDAFDRLTQVTSGAQSFGYAYNGASSQLTALTTPGGGKTEYSYDAMQRLTQVQSVKADNETNLAKFEYGYNTRDVRTFAEKQIGAATAQRVNYSYDQIDQLTKELSTEAAPALDREYSYDAMGNRVSSSVANANTSYTSNNLNQITQTSLGGNNTAIVYDANGNTLQQGNKAFGYNDADQLTSVVVPNQKKSEFTYDSEGRKRISKEFAWDAAANGGVGGWTQSDETRFVYDGMDLVQERAADGTVKASYVRDGNIGGILSRSTPEGTFYYHYDGGGNVVALTDANENIVAQYSYDAFGNTISSSGAQAEKNPFRFSSKYYDGDTGLYDYGFRHYDSSLGRWINRDPIGEDGGLNLYGMVANDPINDWDEYGERGARPARRSIGRPVKSGVPRDTSRNNGRRQPNSPSLPGGRRATDFFTPNPGVPCPPSGPGPVMSARGTRPSSGHWNNKRTEYEKLGTQYLFFLYSSHAPTFPRRFAGLSASCDTARCAFAGGVF